MLMYLPSSPPSFLLSYLSPFLYSFLPLSLICYSIQFFNHLLDHQQRKREREKKNARNKNKKRERERERKIGQGSNITQGQMNAFVMTVVKWGDHAHHPPIHLPTYLPTYTYPPTPTHLPTYPQPDTVIDLAKKKIKKQDSLPLIPYTLIPLYSQETHRWNIKGNYYIYFNLYVKFVKSA